MKLDKENLRRVIREENLQLEINEASKLLELVLDDLETIEDEESLEDVHAVLRKWTKE